jgi:cation diffusion facilitator CzcD-associated flavoprotein CzcO
VADQVVVATATTQSPTWPGQECFRGRILHSSEYRNGKPFCDQSVLLIGFGNSGGEIAMDLHEHGARVTMSVRGTVNVVPREILHLSIVTVSIALSRLPARVADALAAPLLRLTIGNLTKLGFRKAASGPITQIKRTSRVPSSAARVRARGLALPTRLMALNSPVCGASYNPSVRFLS